jgi:membrane fusion protein (multidrug efflux system)
MIARTLPILLIASAFAQEATTVRTVIPVPAAESRAFDLPGRTEPVEQARIFSRATGTVKERPVDIGDRVKAGDTLAVIDIPDIDRELEAAKASVDQAVARAEIARSTSNRTAGLLNSQAVSKEEAEQRQASAAELEAAVRAAKAEVGRLEELQNFAVVKAPFQATIAARRIDRGDFVRGDSATTSEWMFHIVRLNQLRFAVGATPDVALRLTPETEATVKFAELPGRPFPAKVSRSSKLFDTATGTPTSPCPPVSPAPWPSSCHPRPAPSCCRTTRSSCATASRSSPWWRAER